MADEAGRRRLHERWAHLRFSVIGQLLAAPPPKGELQAALRALSLRTWQHPTTGEPVRFGFSTIERWYYRALNERSDPVRVLRRKRAPTPGSSTPSASPRYSRRATPSRTRSCGVRWRRKRRDHPTVPGARERRCDPAKKMQSAPR